MSALTPYMDIPFPNFALEDELAPGRVRPVREVTPVAAVRAVESHAERPEGDRLPMTDGVEVSSAGQRLAEQVAGQMAATDKELKDSVSLTRSRRENLAIRELISSFVGYDNSAAQSQYANYLQLFVTLAADTNAARDEHRARDEVRARENALYASLGFLPADIGIEASVIMQKMALAIDKWLSGKGVFIPSMLSYGSSDGFRFVPLSTASQGALKARDILSSYDRWRISMYLKDMARLTPEDFVFVDPAGLTELGLADRRAFFTEMQQYLDKAGIEARAESLRYAFTAEGRLILTELGLRESEWRKLEAFREAINTYYGMLRASVRQYGAGILSGSLGGAGV